MDTTKSDDTPRTVLPQRPVVVVLCGSTRFGDAYREAQKRETLTGRIVLTVGLLGHAEGIDMDGPVKAMLDELHLRKIDLANEVLVLDVITHVCGACGKPSPYLEKSTAGIDLPWKTTCCKSATWEDRPYVGSSTRNEIAYAIAQGKKVRYLSQEIPHA